MPKKTKPLIFHRGDKWSPTIGNAINRRLVRHRDAIAAILELTEHTEIDAVLNNLSSKLRRCWSLLRDVNKAGSEAQVYHTLKYLLAKRGQLDHTVWEIDPTTRALIEEHHPDGPCALESRPTNSKRLRQATEAAFESLEKPKRGRPKATINYAQHALSKGLAEVYENATGRVPGRSVVLGTLEGTDSDGHYQYAPEYKEQGPFHAFVSLVISLIPRQLQPSEEEVTRLGVELSKEK
ncbi:MAG: hypothetical protein JAZ19_15610 [Candidatus Thiodiazotropha taylori]|nr:hypothetical protein [Candidatus Thiodiazotropha taylori]